MVIFADQMKAYGFHRVFLACVISFGIAAVAQAQRGGNAAWKNYRHEVAVGYGYNTLFSKLGTRDNLGVGFMIQRSTFNASYRYFFLKHFAARATMSHHYARKNDKDNENPLFFTNNQPLDYKTTFSEFGGVVEFHILDEVGNKKRKGKVRRARGGMSRGLNAGLSIYAGFAVDYFRPYGEFQGARVIIRPANDNPGYITNTLEYKRLNMHIPVGATARLTFSEHWSFGVEAGYRIGFRDYVDNVSAVYYEDGPPSGRSIFPDENYTGGNVTFADDPSVGLGALVGENGRRNYFFAQFMLGYRFKT